MPPIRRHKHAVLPSAHLFPFRGCYDSPVSGSAADAFIRHLGREIAEFNFPPTPGLPSLTAFASASPGGSPKVAEWLHAIAGAAETAGISQGLLFASCQVGE